MIAVIANIPTTKLHNWLENLVRPHLTPDVSSYARGRQRVWLGEEPSLTNPTTLKPGLAVSQGIKDRLEHLIGWQFDYCLATYSGDTDAIGIKPHRDAAYANYEAYALNVSEHCEFHYWNGRESFGPGPDKHNYNALVDPPTHELELAPGDLIHFNCKNLHAARPWAKRWNLNFWRAKP